MFTRKGFKFFSTKIKRDFPFIRNIRYTLVTDTLTIVMLRHYSDEDQSERRAVLSSNYHLFLDQGYYTCHQETLTGPHDFGGMLTDDQTPSGEVTTMQFVRTQLARHFKTLLDYMDLVGEYPCHVEFQYPQYELNLFPGDDSLIDKMMSRLPTLLPNDTLAEQSAAFNELARSVARDGSKNDFSFANTVQCDNDKEVRNAINRYNHSFEHLHETKPPTNFLYTINDGKNIRVRVYCWNYNTEERKFANGEYPYDYIVRH